MGVAKTPASCTSPKTNATNDASAGRQCPSGYDCLLALFAGGYGALLGTLPSSVLTGFAGAYVTSILVLVSFFNNAGHGQLKTLLPASPRAIEVLSAPLH